MNRLLGLAVFVALISAPQARAQEDELSLAFKGCLNSQIKVNQAPKPKLETDAETGEPRVGRVAPATASLTMKKTQVDGTFNSIAAISCNGKPAERLKAAIGSFATYSESYWSDKRFIKTWVFGPGFEGAGGSQCNMQADNGYTWCNINLGLFSGVTKALNF